MRAIAIAICATLLAACSPIDFSQAQVSFSDGGTSFNLNDFPFTAGRKWTYALSVAQADKTSTGTMTWEVTHADDKGATVLVTSTLADKTASASSTLTKGSLNAYASVNFPAGVGPAPVTTGNSDISLTTQSVTVPAGTYSAAHTTVAQADGKASSAVETWAANDVGLVKKVVHRLDAGASSSATIELTAVTK